MWISRMQMDVYIVIMLEQNRFRFCFWDSGRPERLIYVFLLRELFVLGAFRGNQNAPPWNKTFVGTPTPLKSPPLKQTFPFGDKPFWDVLLLKTSPFRNKLLANASLWYGTFRSEPNFFWNETSRSETSAEELNRGIRFYAGPDSGSLYGKQKI